MTATVDLSQLRDILLLETHVQDIAGAALETVAGLHPGQRLRCVRAATNHNPFTIALHDGEGRLVGFVPSSDDVLFARLMDAGKTMEARVVDIETVGERLVVHIHLFMRDRATGSAPCP